jgi:hypothetical protein
MVWVDAFLIKMPTLVPTCTQAYARPRSMYQMLPSPPIHPARSSVSSVVRMALTRQCARITSRAQLLLAPGRPSMVLGDASPTKCPRRAPSNTPPPRQVKAAAGRTRGPAPHVRLPQLLPQRRHLLNHCHGQSSAQRPIQFPRLRALLPCPMLLRALSPRRPPLHCSGTAAPFPRCARISLRPHPWPARRSAARRRSPCSG